MQKKDWGNPLPSSLSFQQTENMHAVVQKKKQRRVCEKCVCGVGRGNGGLWDRCDLSLKVFPAPSPSLYLQGGQRKETEEWSEAASREAQQFAAFCNDTGMK